MKCIDILFSSSEEEDDEEFLQLAILRERNKIPKLKNFVTVREYSNNEFQRHFRLTKDTAYKLIEKYEQSSCPPLNNHGGIERKSPEEDVLVFLWFAGNKESLRCVATLFGIFLRTVFYQCNRVMKYLTEIAGQVIKFPDDLDEEARSFEEIAGFPGVIGCIDGSYINIKTPAHKIASTYANRHDKTSITLQAICDAKRKFIDVFTGVPGKVHDARVFKLSDVKQKLPQICGKNYHILGDSAYPIREWLLVPFKNYGNLREMENRYNKKHCQTRIDMHKVEKITKFIVCCCVLHNLCIDNNDIWDEDDIPYNEEEPFVADHEDNIEDDLKNIGELKRFRIMQCL
ncbi:putative nuclease HARBI1 isoform X2 [Temnothorax longispinosus]|uniref:putative nuclease HARBI1 isoform X2 n=1 Tax=Temnothorax longispinosus TaxID=300112 RepID=UPI003A990FF5